MAHFSDPQKQLIWETIQDWIREYGLLFVMRLLADVLAELLENNVEDVR